MLLVILLAGCTTQEIRHAQEEPGFQQARALIAQGKVEEGLALMEQVAATQPDNAEYRSYLSRQRELQLAQLLRTADTQRELQHWNEAETGYQRVLALSTQNQRALEGLKQMDSARKHAAMLDKANALVEKNDTDSAQTVLRSILAEDAGDTAARALYEQLEQKRVAKSTATPQLRSAFKKPITLEFKDIPIKSVFEFIARAANINFTYDKELRQDQKVSIFVRDTSIEDALGVILSTNQLDKKILNDNTLLIYPKSRSSEYQEMFVRSFYLGNVDAKRMMNLIKTVVKTRDVYIDEKLNTLVMRDTPDAIRTAEKLIASQDLAEPEVMLEVEVMEISRKVLEDIGIQYPTKAALGVKGAAGTAGQLSVAELKHFNSGLGVFTITDPVLALNLLNQDSDTNLLANPHIRVKNREKAKIHIGDKLPVITSTANSTGFVSESVNYLEVGIKLDVEPTILLNDEVSIKVALEVSNQTDQVKTSSGTLTYTLGTRNANTVLRLKNGETQVLAGLFRDDAQDTTNKVPGLSSIPLLGRLFSDKNTDRRKKEVVLLITPRILSNIAPPDATYTVFPAGIDSAQNTVGRVGRQPEYVAPAPAATTVQETQAARVPGDKAYADTATQDGTRQ